MTTSMRVRRLSRHEGAAGARGVAVVIDVFRAFTTASFCIAAGAREIVLVKDPEDAFALKRVDPSLFLTGEVGGRPIEGFDVGNSPSRIVDMDLTGRRVVQRTSGGTQGVVAAAAVAREVVLGSLVIASATHRYLATRGDEITLVATGDQEDEECAAHLEALLLGRPTDPAAMLERIWKDEYPGWPDWFPRRDAALACEVDRFDFALPVRQEDGLLVARPVRA